MVTGTSINVDSGYDSGALDSHLWVSGEGAERKGGPEQQRSSTCRHRMLLASRWSSPVGTAPKRTGFTMVSTWLIA
jgi:hypothetical protein